MQYNTNLLSHNQRPFQEIVSLFEKGNKSVLYTAGTGTGKTFITKALLDTIFVQSKVAYVVPTLSLAKYLNDIAGLSVYTYRLKFYTYSFFNDLAKCAREMQQYDLVILDEAHHIGSDLRGGIIQTIMSITSCKYLGLTATPSREDKINVGNFFSKTVNGITHFDAIMQGLMPKFEYIVCSPKLDTLSAEQRKRYNIDYQSSEEFLSALVEQYSRNKWLAFFNSIEKLDEMRPLVERLFPDHEILILHSCMEDDVYDILDRLEKSEKCILLSCDMLLEGYHVPDVDGILLFRNVTSLTVFQQILGRVSSIGSNNNPVVIDCTLTAYALLKKLLRADKATKKSSKSINTARDFVGASHNVISVNLDHYKYYDIMFLLQNMKGRGKGRSKEVVVDNVTYPSKIDCCSQLNVVYESVCRRMRECGETFEQACLILASQNDQHFIVKDVDYVTFEKFCIAMDITKKAITNIAKDNDCSIEVAASTWLDTGAFHYKGKYYKSEIACYRAYGLTRGIITSIINKYSCSKQEAIDKALELGSKPRDKTFVYRMHVFDSAKDCCDTLGVDYRRVASVKNNHGITYQEAIDYVINHDNGDSDKDFVFLEKHYNSRNECCNKLKIPSSTVHDYIKRFGDTPQKAIARYILKHPEKYADIIQLVKVN